MLISSFVLKVGIETLQKKTKSKPWTTHPNFTQMILSNILGPPNVVEWRKSWRATQMMV